VRRANQCDIFSSDILSSDILSSDILSSDNFMLTHLAHYMNKVSHSIQLPILMQLEVI